MSEANETQTRSVGEVKPMSTTMHKESQGKEENRNSKGGLGNFREDITVEKVN